MDAARDGGDPVRPNRPASQPVDPKQLAQDIVREARSRNGLLLFAHYERLIYKARTSPFRGGLPLLVRGALVALAGTARTRVIVISGQDACDLETQVNVPGVIYAGCRGLQLRGAGWNACHPAVGSLRDSLPTLAQQLMDRLARLANIEVEIKELGLTVHLRHADPTILPAILSELEELNLTSARKFRIWPSESTIDLFPNVDGTEDSTGFWPLDEWTRADEDSPVIVYIGDVEAPYVAFHTFGYAVDIGPGQNVHAARYSVVDDAAAVELLSRIAFLWGAGPCGA